MTMSEADWRFWRAVAALVLVIVLALGGAALLGLDLLGLLR
jgi:hypothetical protein